MDRAGIAEILLALSYMGERTFQNLIALRCNSENRARYRDRGLYADQMKLAAVEFDDPSPSKKRSASCRDQDLVAVNQDERSVSVLIGKRDGGFEDNFSRARDMPRA